MRMQPCEDSKITYLGQPICIVILLQLDSPSITPVCMDIYSSNVVMTDMLLSRCLWALRSEQQLHLIPVTIR